jgi:glycosyltransferase involved in cell wall biosynthesis
LNVEQHARVSAELLERAYLNLAKQAALRAQAEARAQSLARELTQATEESARLQAWLTAIRTSASWRLTAPIRVASSLASRLRRRQTTGSSAVPVQAAREPLPELPDRPRLVSRPLRAVHQFHADSASGNAVTQAMLLTRQVLRDLGYDSEIFISHRDPDLTGDLRPFAHIPRHGDYVLIVHHSMGHDLLELVLALPAPKVLIYHGITPPDLLNYMPMLAYYARLGREQLALLAPHVSSALADSDHGAMELRSIGFDPVATCPLLFDIDRMRQRSAAHRHFPSDEPFTVLFVGRVVESKGQLELVEAFAEFCHRFDAPARLILVGTHGGPDESYCALLLAAVRRLGLADQVVLTGAISDAERDDWYRRAALYVSLSLHEGFGVPLVEAMAHGVPVLAWPAGAVLSTVGCGGELLQQLSPSAVAEQMLSLALDPVRRGVLAAQGFVWIERFNLERHVPKLLQALCLAGAAPPPDPDSHAALASYLRFTIAGHVGGAYSLSAINSTLAHWLEKELPGQVHILPIEGEITTDLSRVPAERQAAIAALAGRPPFPSGLEVVIFQHYPVTVPPWPGDLPLALVYWEESLIPAETVAVLNQAFRGVLAPSRFVAKALVDSGVAIPVRTIPQAPMLAEFETLGRERQDRLPDEVFTFLHVSSCFRRKGVDVLLDAYGRAFRADDKVRLVIKAVPHELNEAPTLLALLEVRYPGHAPVELINEELPAAEMLAFYRGADAVVLPTRGEGYNLPAAEAMAAGLPLIVTGYGGQCDFCGPAEARLVAWEFAASASHVASPGSVWAEPCVDDLAAALREAVAEPEAARQRARCAREHITQKTRPGTMVTALRKTAVDLLLAPPPVRVRLGWVTSWDVRCGISEYSRQLIGTVPRERFAELVVLADDRTAPRAGGQRVRPCWRVGDAASIPALTEAIWEEDPHVVVVQHDPDLLPWAGLTALLTDEALAGRSTLVMLHNTKHLQSLVEDQRRAVLGALSGTGRVLVHTVADLNRLKGWGLVGNTILLPHGAPQPLSRRGARRLAPTDKLLIGSYGFFLPAKGLSELVQALAVLRRDWPRARLRLVNAESGASESADEIANCQRMLHKLGLAGAVEFHTDFLPIERSLALLADCDVLALPYQASRNSCSGAVRMALAAAVPVVVTPLPLFDEVGEAVARLPGLDPVAIAEGLAALLDSTERRNALTIVGECWLHEHLWPSVAMRLGGLMSAPENVRRSAWDPLERTL